MSGLAGGSTQRPAEAIAAAQASAVVPRFVAAAVLGAATAGADA